MRTLDYILSIRHFQTNFNEILITIQTFFYSMKMFSAKCMAFCPGFNMLTLRKLEIEYIRLWGSMAADALANLSRQSISRHGIDCVTQTLCIDVPELISSTWFKPNPRYNSKCEYFFYYLHGNNIVLQHTTQPTDTVEPLCDHHISEWF